MKRLALIVLTLIGLSCALPFPAMGQDSGIVGTWTIPMEFEGKTATLCIRFDVNGRYRQWSPGYEGVTQGTYHIYGNELKMVINDGREFHSHFFLPNPNVLTLQNSTGQFQYARVSDAASEPPNQNIAGQDSNFVNDQQEQQQQQQTDIYDANTDADNSAPAQDTPYELGCKLFEQGDLNGALAAFSQVIGQDPTNAQAFYKRGLVYEKLNDLLKSYNDLEKARALDPDNDEYHKALDRLANTDAPKAMQDTWNAAVELKKRQYRESLFKQLPYRLAGSVFSVLILACYWFFFFRTRKPSATPRPGSAKFFRILVLIFGIVLTLFLFLFVWVTMAPYFASS